MELKEGDSVLYKGIEYLYDGECKGSPVDCHIRLPEAPLDYRMHVKKAAVFTFANWVRLERKKAGYEA